MQVFDLPQVRQMDGDGLDGLGWVWAGEGATLPDYLCRQNEQYLMASFLLPVVFASW